MDESLISRITPADVAVLVSRSALQKAYEDYRQARVGKLSCVVGVDDETSIRARVRGAAGESYEVEAFMTEDMVTGGLDCSSSCICDSLHPC